MAPLGINVIRDRTVSQFMVNAGPLLYKQEAVNSLLLGLGEGLASHSSLVAPLLLRVVEGTRTIAAALQTPPRNLVLSHLSAEASFELVNFLRNERIVLPGVIGPAADAERFAAAWCASAGLTMRLGMAQQILRLDTVRLPKGVPGFLREATPDDHENLVEWNLAFAREALSASEHGDRGSWNKFTERAIAQKTPHLWTVEGGAVAMAFATRPTRNGIMLAGVYTPPEHRRHGYASAAVALLSQKMLDSGRKFCVLYTNLANPTSNKIYRDVGYVELADSSHYEFS